MSIQEGGRSSRTRDFPGDLYLYSISEIIICEWRSPEASILFEHPLCIKADEIRGPYFDAKAKIYAHCVAWPCSISHHSEEDGEWAIDQWEPFLYKPDNVKLNGSDATELVAVGLKLRLAIRGYGTRLNRIGYQMQIFASEQARWSDFDFELLKVHDSEGG
jgi:hypothetical protein